MELKQEVLKPFTYLTNNMQAVHVPTQKDYDTLMAAYERKGWKWSSGVSPAQVNHWSRYAENTHVDLNDRFEFSSKRYYELKGHEVLTLNQALKILNMQRSIEDVQSGDLIQNGVFYQRVLQTLGEGQYKLVFVSEYDSDKNGDCLLESGYSHTLAELKDYHIVDESAPKKMTVAEIAAKLGHDVEVVK